MAENSEEGLFEVDNYISVVDVQIQKLVNLSCCLGFFSLINIDEGLDIMGELAHVI